MRAAAIGNFDGVHRGHVHLLQHLAAEAAKRSLSPAAITFSRHPLEIIDPARVPARLTSDAERARLLSGLGVEIITLPFTPALRAMTAAEFLTMIRRDYDVSLLLMGFNNRIGSDRLSAGSPALQAAAAEAGVELGVSTELDDKGVSSSAVRAALEEGNVALAAELLGRPYAIEGTVVSGRRLGRTIGFPTANIETAPGTALPAPGVYLGRSMGHRAVVNIGRRPTVEGRDDAPLSIEAHLLDYSGDLYGHNIRLEFIDRLRGEKRFGSLEKLKAAIANDVTKAYERDF